MYLALLNKEQKECFLGLAYNISNIDGNYSESEQKLLESYCDEMNLDYSDSVAKKDLKKLFSNLSDIFDERTIKIVAFELIGLAMVDNNFDKSEYDMINKIIGSFAIDSDFIKNSQRLIQTYLEVQFNINALILS